VRKIFDEDEDDEQAEEIPLEMRIRMRNVGRNTPTASGPNSFGKSRLGFCDYRAMQERELAKQVKDIDAHGSSPSDKFC